MADEDEVDAAHWTELLPDCPLFTKLREDVCRPQQGYGLMCEIRGDLFVWDETKKSLLTTNLKRLMAYPGEQFFQALLCTSAPQTEVWQLLPDPSGSYVALVCRQSVSVMRLHRHRGQYGEFGGGKESVNCKVIPVAKDLFTVYRSLNVIQTEWHPSQPGTMLLLTSDSTLRIFSLANPSLPLLTLPLVESPSVGYTLKDSIVRFVPSPSSSSSSSPLLFLLSDSGDILTVQVEEGVACSPPLVMHPEAEHNYDEGPSSLLLLPTTPLTVIISNYNGMIHHCIHLPREEDDEVGVVSELLYVVESIRLEFSCGESSVKLMPDPVDPHRYFAVHSEGVHMIFLPWLANMEAFALSDLSTLRIEPEASIQWLLSTEPDVLSLQGVVVVSEPLLGRAFIAVNSDWECCAVALSEGFSSLPPSSRGDQRVLPIPLGIDVTDGGFEEVIRDILLSHSTSPARRSTSGPRFNASQKDCFEFLRHSINSLRTQYLLNQKRAMSELRHRIDLLCEQKQQQLDELTDVRYERETAEQRMDQLRERVGTVRLRHTQLKKRVDKLVCQLDAQSPVLSDAEVLMSQELQGLSERVRTVAARISEAQGKLSLELERGHSAKVTLSSQQCSTVLSALTEGGHNIKALKNQVRSLKAALPS